jgi:hypothetical protein
VRQSGLIFGKRGSFKLSRYGAGLRAHEPGSILGKGKTFVSTAQCPDRLWSTPCRLPNTYRGGGPICRGVNLKTRPHLVPTVRKLELYLLSLKHLHRLAYSACNRNEYLNMSGGLDISEPCRTPRPVTWIALLFCVVFIVCNASFIFCVALPASLV